MVNPQKQSFDKLKILTFGNASFTGTGYGVQLGEFKNRIKNRYDLRCYSNYGLQGAALNINGVVEYPQTFTQFSEDGLEIVMRNWKPHVLLTVMDIWIGKNSSLGEDWFYNLAENHNAKWIPWIPVDQYPIADGVAEQAFKAYKPVAMSKFGFNELKRIGVDPVFIPHGVDTNVFKPLSEEGKTESKIKREKHSSPIEVKAPAKITEDSFVVGVNAANKDPMRKDWGRMLSAFAIFLSNNPDAKKDAVLDLHTWVNFPGGFRLGHLAAKLGISANVKHTHVYDMLCALPPERMNEMYNSWDVSMLLSRGEGFGVPIIESEACGVPVIGTDCTAITELIGNHGWLIPLFGDDVECPHCKKSFSYHGGAKMFDHLISYYVLPDEYKAADALEDAYNHPNKLTRLSKSSRVNALNYDFEKRVIPDWCSLFDELECELNFFGAAENKDKSFNALFAREVQGGV